MVIILGTVTILIGLWAFGKAIQTIWKIIKGRHSYGEIENVLPIPRPKASPRPQPHVNKIMCDAIHKTGVSFTEAAARLSQFDPFSKTTCPKCKGQSVYQDRDIFKQIYIFYCEDCGWEGKVSDGALRQSSLGTIPKVFEPDDQVDSNNPFKKEEDWYRKQVNEVDVNKAALEKFQRDEVTGRLSVLTLDDLRKPAEKEPAWKPVPMADLKKIKE